MVKYINDGDKLMDHNELINIFNSRNMDEAKMRMFDKITNHSKIPGANWKVKMLWDNG